MQPVMNISDDLELYSTPMHLNLDLNLLRL